MDFDDTVLPGHDHDAKAWAGNLSKVAADVCELASKYRGGQSCSPSGLFSGSFNFCIKVQFDSDLEEWVLRFPMPGKVMFIEEKLRNEVATMRYIKDKTNIPVPTVIAWGLADDNPTGLGAFLITRWVDGQKLSELLEADSLDEDGDKVLRGDISTSTLEMVYRQIADIMLELSEHEFDRIGALTMDDEGGWTVGSRPLSLHMNEIARCGGVLLQPRVCSSAADYILDLIEQGRQHVQKQRNGVYGALDARLKYTSRRLFRAIAPSFISRKFNQGPFTLFCDDFRPSNILVDKDLKITAVLDWEWWYTAPYQFLYAPPWWLICKDPSGWRNTDDDLLDAYLPQLALFLKALEERERVRYGDDLHRRDDRMSTLMRRSMADFSFWFNEGARNSWAVDSIYWDRLDEFCFGRLKDDQRIEEMCRSPVVRQDMENFVNTKLEDLRKYNTELGREVKAEDEEKVEKDNPMMNGHATGNWLPAALSSKLQSLSPWRSRDSTKEPYAQVSVNFTMAIGTAAVLVSSFVLARRFMSNR